MLPEQQQRIMGYFIEEAKDHLNTIEQGLLNLQTTIEDPELVNEVFTGRSLCQRRSSNAGPDQHSANSSPTRR